VAEDFARKPHEVEGVEENEVVMKMVFETFV
jgi:hypothetical protein